MSGSVEENASELHGQDFPIVYSETHREKLKSVCGKEQ